MKLCKVIQKGSPEMDDTEDEVPEWITEVLDRWVPPDDYDVRMQALVSSYIAEEEHGAVTARRQNLGLSA